MSTKGTIVRGWFKENIDVCSPMQKFTRNILAGGYRFYLDCTGWVHKTMPEFIVHVTGKKSVNVCAVTAHWKQRRNELVTRWQGLWLRLLTVIKFYHYEGAINAEMCKYFIEEHFSDMFEKSANPKGKLVFARWPFPKQKIIQRWYGWSCLPYF